jgi:hypothetical protein
MWEYLKTTQIYDGLIPKKKEGNLLKSIHYLLDFTKYFVRASGTRIQKRQPRTT